jgi:2-polyprenyl-3-methyl-5-hydroxy-6-metoxy-1,4-benzoquinol methylase
MTLDSQANKYGIRSLRGFNFVLVYGLGQRLGIFDHLGKKTENIKQIENQTISTFNFDDIINELKLDENYFDGWLHMALESGIFELDETCGRCFKTGPFIFDLLIDKNNSFYIGNLITWIYYNALFQNDVYERFHSGTTIDMSSLPPEWNDDFQKMSGQQSVSLEKIFAANFEEFTETVKKGGKILDVGCGHGYPLKEWAKRYKNAEITGLDIDDNAIENAKEMVKKYHLENRIQIVKSELHNFAEQHPQEFDIIILHNVLHEIKGDDSIRKEFINNLYLLLNDNGKVILGESMIPSVFTPKTKFLFFEIAHKWFEILFGSRFYDENQFRDFISTTSFANAELLKRGTDYIWILHK